MYAIARPIDPNDTTSVNGTVAITPYFTPFADATGIIAGVDSTMAKPDTTPAKSATTASKINKTPAKTSGTTTPQSTTLPGRSTSYTPAQISGHFLDIAFSPDNTVITRWDASRVTVAITGVYTPADVNRTNDFITVFNRYSSTSQLSDTVKESETGDIVLNFMPESTLGAIYNGMKQDDDWIVSRNMKTGQINFLVRPSKLYSGKEFDEIYINADFKGDVRAHWHLRALLYGLGFTGESGTYPSSIFYSAGTSKIASLDLIDWKACPADVRERNSQQDVKEFGEKQDHLICSGGVPSGAAGFITKRGMGVSAPII